MAVAVSRPFDDKGEDSRLDQLNMWR